MNHIHRRTAINNTPPRPPCALCEITTILRLRALRVPCTSLSASRNERHPSAYRNQQPASASSVCPVRASVHLARNDIHRRTAINNLPPRPLCALCEITTILRLRALRVPCASLSASRKERRPSTHRNQQHASASSVCPVRDNDNPTSAIHSAMRPNTKSRAPSQRMGVGRHW